MKHKKLLYGMLGIAMAVCMGFLLAACNSGETPDGGDDSRQRNNNWG